MTLEIHRLPEQKGGTVVRDGVTYTLTRAAPLEGLYGVQDRGRYDIRRESELVGTVYSSAWFAEHAVHATPAEIEARTLLVREIAQAWSGTSVVLDWLIERCPEIAPMLRKTRERVVAALEGSKAFVVQYSDTSAAAFTGVWTVATPFVLVEPTPEDSQPTAPFAASARAFLWREGIRSYVHIRKSLGGPGPLNVPLVGGGMALDD